MEAILTLSLLNQLLRTEIRISMTCTRNITKYHELKKNLPKAPCFKHMSCYRFHCMLILIFLLRDNDYFYRNIYDSCHCEFWDNIIGKKLSCHSVHCTTVLVNLLPHVKRKCDFCIFRPFCKREIFTTFVNTKRILRWEFVTKRVNFLSPKANREIS